MINRTDSERLEVIIEKLGQIVDLLTPKEVKIKLGASEMAQITESKNSIVQMVRESFGPSTTESTLPIGKVTLGQHTRKRMIKAAQDAHRILASNVYSSPDGTTFMYGVIKNGRHKYMCTADFIVSKEKRKVICLMKEKDTNKVLAKGISKCDPADVFNVDIGMAIALYRALGLVVPSNYFEIANPTEYEAGQIVQWAEGFPFLVVATDGDYADFRRVHDGKEFNNFWFRKETSPAKIIEDGVEV
ncbi:hypothetical protein CPT_Stahl16 [Bacillus phage Stahl]|uniref:Uncharacterized protein n=1 Tax=Bacillus phage Stahl TaxID=1610832 RepID=A0A0E3GMN0_9CAUD|nr:hypothetical protein CPT_Stahl16 [Bacillus phage Stahl]AKA61444.1 hypothetical protein CPT_Stahl16 [Bacillus phage Stahl]